MRKIAFTLFVLAMGIWCMENREKVSSKYDLASKSVKRFLWETKSAQPVADTADTDESPMVLKEPAKEDSPQILTLPIATILTQELAPDLYYTKERLTMMSDDGIRVIAECMLVQKVGEQDGKFIVKDEKVQLMTDPWKLTRDTYEIDRLKKRAVALQESIRPPAVTSATNVKKAKGNTSNSKKDTPALISSERAQIEAQISNINLQITNLRADIFQKQLAEHEARRMGRTSSHSATASRLRLQVTALENQRTYYTNLLKTAR